MLDADHNLGIKGHDWSLDVSTAQWRHPVEEMEPEAEDVAIAEKLDMLCRLLDWLCGPKRKLGARATDFATVARRLSSRFLTALWLVRPCAYASLPTPPTLTDLATFFGLSRARLSSLSLEMKEQLGGALAGASNTGKTDSGRERYRQARYASLERQRESGAEVQHHERVDRDSLDEGPAMRGLEKMVRRHATNGERIRASHEHPHEFVTGRFDRELTRGERRAMLRRGWIDAGDLLTDDGIAAAREHGFLPSA